MKKVFMQIKKSIGMIAMGAAVLAVTLNVVSANAKSNKTGRSSHFWYLIDSTGKVATILGTMDDDQVVNFYGCDDQGGTYCAAGFNADAGLDEGDDATHAPEILTKAP